MFSISLVDKIWPFLTKIIGCSKSSKPAVSRSIFTRTPKPFSASTFRKLRTSSRKSFSRPPCRSKKLLDLVEGKLKERNGYETRWQNRDGASTILSCRELLTAPKKKLS